MPRKVLKADAMSSKPKPSKGPNGRFLSGNIGGGRPVGARNKLSEAFLEVLSADFEKHGAEVIERVRTEDPAAYLRTVASLTPRKVEMEAVGGVESLSDAQLDAIIRASAAEEGIEIPPPCLAKMPTRQ